MQAGGHLLLGSVHEQGQVAKTAATCSHRAQGCGTKWGRKSRKHSMCRDNRTWAGPSQSQSTCECRASRGWWGEGKGGEGPPHRGWPQRPRWVGVVSVALPLPRPPSLWTSCGTHRAMPSGSKGNTPKLPQPTIPCFCHSVPQKTILGADQDPRPLQTLTHTLIPTH